MDDASIAVYKEMIRVIIFVLDTRDTFEVETQTV
jgi:hypothetical protein